MIDEIVSNRKITENELIQSIKQLKKNEKITIVKFNNFGHPIILETKFINYITSDKGYEQAFNILYKLKHERKNTYIEILKPYNSPINHKINDFLIIKGWHNLTTNKIKYDKPIQKGIRIIIDNNFMAELLKQYANKLIYGNVTIN